MVSLDEDVGCSIQLKQQIATWKVYEIPIYCGVVWYSRV